MICVDAEGLAASRPHRPLFADLSVTVSTGDRLGVVGLNGCGKSTLLRYLAGVSRPEIGTVRWGRGARTGMLDQDLVLPAGTVDAAVDGGWQGAAVLDRLGMGALGAVDTTELSGGQRKRVALARLLAGEHDLLILDEPTNHLDLDAIAFLEGWLATFTGGLVLVTHDRHVLDRVTNKVLELDRGRGYLHLPTSETGGSGYAAYLAGRAEREERAAVTEDVRRNLARKELAWLRRGAPARTSKPKARIASATAIVEGRAEAAVRSGELDLALGSARLGSKVVELHDVGFTWPGGTRPVLSHIDHIIEPGDRLGVVGVNGAGKTTLLELIAGRLEPTVGRVERGVTVKVGYHDQLGVTLDPAQRVREAVAGPDRPPNWEDARLMERFWFDGDAQWAEIGTLSGGERRRLQLLMVLVSQPNVLLLDEPTNDLDLDTLRALEDFLDDWPGALVVVSHDRTFLDRTVEEVLALDGTGRAGLVRGGYAGWMAARSGVESTSIRRRATPSASGPEPDRSAQARPAEPSGEPVRSPRSAPDVSGASATTAPAARPKAARSPSTLRRLLGQAERELADAIATRSELVAQLASIGADHERLARLGVDLATTEHVVAAAEERWLALADEAEAAGLDI